MRVLEGGFASLKATVSLGGRNPSGALRYLNYMRNLYSCIEAISYS